MIRKPPYGGRRQDGHRSWKGQFVSISCAIRFKLQKTGHATRRYRLRAYYTENDPRPMTLLVGTFAKAGWIPDHSKLLHDSGHRKTGTDCQCHRRSGSKLFVKMLEAGRILTEAQNG